MANEIIGKGLLFPLQIDSRGRLALSEGKERVEQAIWLIIRTCLRERVMRPTFGVGLDDRVFDNNSHAAQIQLASDIRQALAKWEPRIDVDNVIVSVKCTEDEEKQMPGHENHVSVKIEYHLRNVYEPQNTVYPKNIEEGVN